MLFKSPSFWHRIPVCLGWKVAGKIILLIIATEKYNFERNLGYKYYLAVNKGLKFLKIYSDVLMSILLMSTKVLPLGLTVYDDRLIFGPSGQFMFLLSALQVHFSGIDWFIKDCHDFCIIAISDWDSNFLPYRDKKLLLNFLVMSVLWSPLK